MPRGSTTRGHGRSGRHCLQRRPNSLALPNIQVFPIGFPAGQNRPLLKRSGRAMLDPNRSIADEVEAAINAGSTEKHLETIKRVTNLFLSSADSFDGEQIELFDDVLERLIRTIELRAIADMSTRIALAEMSTQLASVPKAPPSVVRRLARHDEIAIAGPVLTESARLTNEDLIEIAGTKS